MNGWKEKYSRDAHTWPRKVTSSFATRRVANAEAVW
jgi:hypothetical protein